MTTRHETAHTVERERTVSVCSCGRRDVTPHEVGADGKRRAPKLAELARIGVRHRLLRRRH